MKTLILIYLKMIQIYFFKNNIEISNDEKVFEDDIVYIQDLENNLLDQYPLYKQGYKYIHDKIKKKVYEIINIKNYGLKLLNKDKYYSFTSNNIIKGNYIYNWLKPVVEVIKKLYFIKNIKDEDDTNDFNVNSISEKFLPFFKKYYDDGGCKLINFIDNLKQIDELKTKFKKDIITFKNYTVIYNDLAKPFITKNKLEKGFIFDNKNSVTAIRSHNLRTKKWETVKINGELYTYINILDDNEKIIGSKRKNTNKFR